MLEMIDRLITPELHIGPVRVKVSVSAILENDGRLLLIRETDGYGPPAGHCEEYEHLNPKGALLFELAEETNVYGFGHDDMSLWGRIMYLRGKQLSIGLVYKVRNYEIPPAQFRHITDEDIIEQDFFGSQQIQSLLREGNIRKEKWNRPILEAWLQHKKSLFVVGRDRRG